MPAYLIRGLSVFALLLAPLLLWGQQVDWATVDVNYKKLDPKLRPAKITERQEATVQKLILKDAGDFCTFYPNGAGVLSYFIAPVGRSGIVYVVPGTGCFRGGQGSNASLWLVDTSVMPMQLIATPEKGFAGWGLGIQPAKHHGLHDIVTGTHMSAFETVLTYLRFDGITYAAVAETTVVDCDKLAGHGTNSHRCFQGGGHVFDSGSY